MNKEWGIERENIFFIWSCACQTLKPPTLKYWYSALPYKTGASYNCLHWGKSFLLFREVQTLKLIRCGQTSIEPSDLLDRKACRLTRRRRPAETFSLQYISLFYSLPSDFVKTDLQYRQLMTYSAGVYSVFIKSTK